MRPPALLRSRRPSARCASRCAGPSVRARAFGTQPGRAMFGIVQGGAERSLRIESARALADMEFDGYAIGGLAVGEPQAVMLEMIETVEPLSAERRSRAI